LKLIYIFIGAALLSACTTLETYVSNADTQYERVPIVVRQGLFSPDTITMGAYSMVEQWGKLFDSYSVSGFGGTFYDKKSRSYLLYRDREALYPVMLTQQTVGIEGFDWSISSSRYFIRFKTNTMIKECEINRSNSDVYCGFDSDVYFEVDDDYAGTVVIRNYKSINKNDQSKAWTYHTGFTVTIDNEEYGILAFYNAAWYRNKIYAGKMDQTINDRLALYLLAIYENWLRYH
jgi:hypothetical protein